MEQSSNWTPVTGAIKLQGVASAERLIPVFGRLSGHTQIHRSPTQTQCYMTPLPSALNIWAGHENVCTRLKGRFKNAGSIPCPLKTSAFPFQHVSNNLPLSTSHYQYVTFSLSL
eukprot:1160935-Pelagomonas_calceolata.AAC.6